MTTSLRIFLIVILLPAFNTGVSAQVVKALKIVYEISYRGGRKPNVPEKCYDKAITFSWGTKSITKMFLPSNQVTDFLTQDCYESKIAPFNAYLPVMIKTPKSELINLSVNRQQKVD